MKENPTFGFEKISVICELVDAIANKKFSNCKVTYSLNSSVRTTVSAVDLNAGRVIEKITSFDNSSLVSR